MSAPVQALFCKGASNALLTSLISYWKMDEASGNALDSHGTNELTDNNTVGSTTGIISNSRDFENSSTEYFSRASNSTLQVGDIDFTFSIWFQLESKSTYRLLISKDDSSLTNREYLIYYDVATDRLSFAITADGSTIVEVQAATFGSPSTATWIHAFCWHDSTANQIGIRINDTSENTASHSTGVFTGTSAFMIGQYGTAAAYASHDGLIDEVAFWKRLLTAGEKTDVYNAGAGRAYSYYQ